MLLRLVNNDNFKEISTNAAITAVFITTGCHFHIKKRTKEMATKKAFFQWTTRFYFNPKWPLQGFSLTPQRIDVQLTSPLYTKKKPQVG